MLKEKIESEKEWCWTEKQKIESEKEWCWTKWQLWCVWRFFIFLFLSFINNINKSTINHKDKDKSIKFSHRSLAIGIVSQLRQNVQLLSRLYFRHRKILLKTVLIWPNLWFLAIYILEPQLVQMHSHNISVTLMRDLLQCYFLFLGNVNLLTLSDNLTLALHLWIRLQTCQHAHHLPTEPEHQERIGSGVKNRLPSNNFRKRHSSKHIIDNTSPIKELPLKNSDHINQEIALPSIPQPIDPIFELGREHAQHLKHTKVHHPLKQHKQVLNVKVNTTPNYLVILNWTDNL